MAAALESGIILDQEHGLDSYNLVVLILFHLDICIQGLQVLFDHIQRLGDLDSASFPDGPFHAGQNHRMGVPCRDRKIGIPGQKGFHRFFGAFGTGKNGPAVVARRGQHTGAGEQEDGRQPEQGEIDGEGPLMQQRVDTVDKSRNAHHSNGQRHPTVNRLADEQCPLAPCRGTEFLGQFRFLAQILGSIFQPVHIFSRTVGEFRQNSCSALFIPPVAVSLVPAVYGLIAGGAERTDALLFSLPMALVCLLCWALYPLIFRQRADVVDTDSDLNAALTRVRRYNWGKMLLGTEYLTAAFGVAFWLLRNDGLWTTLLTIAYMFALIAFCLSTEFAVRRAQERLTAAHRSDEYVDEDDLWLWGLFYNNPNDRHIFINDRTGSGMGVNVGRPAGRVIVVGTALLLVGMMVLGVCLSAGFDAPREAHIDDGVLYFRHFTEKYEIPLEDITSLELIDELPGAKRIAGTGLPNLVEGRFRVEGYENTRISLNPEEPPYIAVVTADMSRIFALGTPQETEAFYNELKEALS